MWSVVWSTMGDTINLVLIFSLYSLLGWSFVVAIKYLASSRELFEQPSITLPNSMPMSTILTVSHWENQADYATCKHWQGTLVLHAMQQHYRLNKIYRIPPMKQNPMDKTGSCKQISCILTCMILLCITMLESISSKTPANHFVWLHMIKMGDNYLFLSRVCNHDTCRLCSKVTHGLTARGTS